MDPYVLEMTPQAPVLTDTSRMGLPTRDHLETLSVIGTELMIGRVISHQGNGTHARRFVLTRRPRILCVGRAAISIRSLAIAEEFAVVRLAR